MVDDITVDAFYAALETGNFERAQTIMNEIAEEDEDTAAELQIDYEDAGGE
jgi:hypothetical protein